MFPTVSIVIPCYNMGKYIYETVNSVKLQTYQNYEIIIVDDGSTDSLTMQALLSIEKEGVSVKYTSNCGVSSARNTGISSAKGKYILCLDSDDIVRPTFLEKTVAVLDRDEKIGVVYTGVETFGDSSTIWNLRPPVPENMVYGNSIVITSLFRKQIWESVEGFKCNFFHGLEDWDFWLSAMESGFCFYGIEEPLFLYRIRNVSRNSLVTYHNDKYLATMELIINNHIELFRNNSAHIVEHIRKMSLPQQQDISWVSAFREQLNLTEEDENFIQLWNRYFELISTKTSHLFKVIASVSTLPGIRKKMKGKLVFRYLKKRVRNTND